MRGLWFHQFYRNRYGAGKNDWHYPSLKEFNQFSKLFNKVSFRTFGFIGINKKVVKNITLWMKGEKIPNRISD